MNIFINVRTYATGIKRGWADRANTSEHDKLNVV